LLIKIYFPSAVPQLEKLVAYEEQLSSFVKDLLRLSPAQAQTISDKLIVVTIDVAENSIELK